MTKPKPPLHVWRDAYINSHPFGPEESPGACSPGVPRCWVPRRNAFIAAALAVIGFTFCQYTLCPRTFPQLVIGTGRPVLFLISYLPLSLWAMGLTERSVSGRAASGTHFLPW
jgi:hypothetical protein